MSSAGGIGTDYAQPSDEELDPDYVDEKVRLLSLVRDGTWLDQQVFPPLRWAVPGLIPQGFGLFTGPPKAGKSWAALDIALAVASGGKALGTIDVANARPVLYLALEDGDSRLQWRSRRLLQDQPIPANLNTITQLSPRDVLPLIWAWLATDGHGHQKPLILLDTLGKVMPPALPGEGAYQRDYRIGGRLKEITDTFVGATLLVVHHVRKQSGDDWMDSTSGTNGLNGSADFTLNLFRRRNEDTGLFRVSGRDVEEGEYAATTTDGSWTLDGSDLAEAAKAAAERTVTESLGDESAAIVAFVADHPDGVRAAEVALALQMDGHKARTYLSRLADAGRLRKLKRGLYGSVASVATVACVWGEPGNATHATDATAQQRGPACAVCGEPMLDPEPGETTHPTCGDVS